MNYTVDYSYTRGGSSPTSGFMFKGRHYRCSLLRFKSPFSRPARGTENVEIYNFVPKSEVAGSLIMIHGLGSVNIPFLFWMGTHLASVGLQASLIVLPGNYTRTADGSVSGKDYFSTDLGNLLRFWQHAVVDVRASIDVLEDRNEWRENNGIVGYCLGGMVATLATVLDERISRTILMTTGSNMARILWESPTLKFVRRDFKQGKGSEGFLNDRARLYARYDNDLAKCQKFRSVEELLSSEVHPLLKVDPLSFARFVPTKKTTMIEAIFDKTLPRETRSGLWRAMGRPRRYLIPSGHVTWLPFQYVLAQYILKTLGIRDTVRKMRLLSKTEFQMPIEEAVKSPEASGERDSQTSSPSKVDR
ncbi:MAG: Uncharacterized protein XE05_0813 [Thermotogales bacterium 46_20]|nr:MAG: Uncharacterized protein XE05_0813 [Thermotogales bacterium 46_20]